MGYLEEVLEGQRVDGTVMEAVRARRAGIEETLRGGWKDGGPRFYYGGSFAKRTAIAAQFDVDVVMYFPPKTDAAPRRLYEAVERRLRAAGHVPERHNVALRLRYTPGWHLDVVPGRALDAGYEYASLYAVERDTTRQTSLKAHIELARNGDRDVIRLLKLWRWRNQAAVSSFVLELAAARVLRGGAGGSLEERFGRVLRFLAEEFEGARLVDPANSNNVVTEDMEWFRKREVAEKARAGLRAGWERVVW